MSMGEYNNPIVQILAIDHLHSWISEMQRLASLMFLHPDPIDLHA